MHRTIGAILKDDHGQGLLQVEVPDTTKPPPPGETYGDPRDPKLWRGQWRSITDPEEMAKEVAKSNIRSYNQAHNTPFASGPLGKALGQYAMTDIADQILAGENLQGGVTEELMEETKRMLKVLGTKPALITKELTSEITPKDFCSMYRVVSENTSSSPSERHVGTYKADTKSPNLSQMYADMMSLPIREGFAPSRWQVVLDVMLPKERNNWKIHRLRIIQLYESDENQAWRHIFARQMVFLMEDSNIVPEMQFSQNLSRCATVASFSCPST
mmetsp:Transcript_7001/g.10196  ORF Transcript_7001/g.10196 Transcript_7001/m.10196 type:complete len:272 (+) Transcript_7001:3260-4075(+)